MGKLIIVSNRGPFSFSKAFFGQAVTSLDRGLAPEPPKFGEGGLVKAMSGLLRHGRWDPTWIGASMGDRDIDVARGHYLPFFKKMSNGNHAPAHFPHIEIEPDGKMHFRYKDYDFCMRFVFFDTKHMHSYYNKFANGFLWPLMHLTRPPLFYKKSTVFPRPQFEKNDFVQYTSSSVTFANTIIDEIQKRKEVRRAHGEVLVWSQDYHLMQIAEILKSLLLEEGMSGEQIKRIHVGHFMHTPFFNIHEIQGLIREDKRNRVKAQIYEPFGETIETVLQKLTWGMLFNDFIGFHTKEYCDNYLEALEEWFPVEIKIVEQFYQISHQGGVTTIGAFPIGLDVDTILAEVSNERILEYGFNKENLKDKIFSDRKKGMIIFGGLERCDYTKGLLERLIIFQHSLNKLKTIGREARFYQVTAPSRLETLDYRDLNKILKHEISKMNDKLQGEYIVHIDKGIPPPQNYRFMKEIDVMFVTPLEDGMNLVAFEYILSQKYKRPEDRGILVLSTSGASRALKQRGFSEEDGIVFVNPMKKKEAGNKAAEAFIKGRHLSEDVIRYVERERRIDDWAERNVDSILNCAHQYHACL